MYHSNSASSSWDFVSLPLCSAIHTSGVITPQLEAFLPWYNPPAKHPFRFYYRCLLFGLNYLLCTTGCLPAASETNSDEVGEANAADALPAVPATRTVMQNPAPCPQTSVLSPSPEFWSYGGGELPLMASGMVVKRHFPFTFSENLCQNINKNNQKAQLEMQLPKSHCPPQIPVSSTNPCVLRLFTFCLFVPISHWQLS